MGSPAYQVLAERIRSRIVAGELKPGDRLLGEADLCLEAGVSRSTVREAIRLLEAQNLVVTTRGTTGGSFVAEPRAEQVGSALGAGLDLLVAHESLSVEQLLEARMMLEVPAVELAACRRTDGHLAELEACIAEGRRANERFHRVLLDASGNPLLAIMTAPLFAVLHDRVERDRATAAQWDELDADHRRIHRLVHDGDAAGAAAEMRSHLERLTALYSAIDRRNRDRADPR